MEFIFDVAAFRLAYPQFADPTAFPNAILQAYWNTAINYITNQIYGCTALNGMAQDLAINLMTAHLSALSVMIASGQTPSLVQSATIDKITVSLTPPPLENQWQWWLSLTPYGQQLLALLQVVSVGGFYVGGLPQRAAFRKVGGVF